MLVLVILLALTNIATVGFVVWLMRRHEAAAPVDADTRALAESLRHSDSAVRPRRLISIEILNPIELAGTRGFLARVAGSLAPRIVRRAVYDETLKQLRQQLKDEHVVADVRLHRLPETGRTVAAEELITERADDEPDDVLDAQPVSVEVEKPPTQPPAQ